MYRLILLLVTLVWSLQAPALEVRDGSGRTIELAQPAARIVALAPDLVENLYAIGAGETLVGRIAHADYPAAARRAALVGDYQSFDAETILALRPDLVLAWQEGNPPERLRQLEALGLVVVRLSSLSIEAIPANLRLLGRLTGRDAEARRQAETFTHRLQQLAPAPGADRPLLFYQLWPEPLLTVSDGTLIGQAIRFCGADNPFGARPELAPQLSVEAVIAAAPDLIVGTDEAGEQWRARWLHWPGIPAVAQQRLVTLPADLLHRATPRFLDGLAALCDAVQAARAE